MQSIQLLFERNGANKWYIYLQHYTIGCQGSSLVQGTIRLLILNMKLTKIKRCKSYLRSRYLMVNAFNQEDNKYTQMNHTKAT